MSGLPVFFPIFVFSLWLGFPGFWPVGSCKVLGTFLSIFERLPKSYSPYPTAPRLFLNSSMGCRSIVYKQLSKSFRMTSETFCTEMQQYPLGVKIKKRIKFAANKSKKHAT
jgi:hypothetical protein